MVLLLGSSDHGAATNKSFFSPAKGPGGVTVPYHFLDKHLQLG